MLPARKIFSNFGSQAGNSWILGIKKTNNGKMKLSVTIS